MCLVLFAWQAHENYPLVLAANRDEFHQRPAAAAQWWQDQPGILAGRDLQAGGTWMGVSRDGRIAALTNYREPGAPVIDGGRSRGDLVRDFLAGGESPRTHAAKLQCLGAEYAGFNLLLGDRSELGWVSNRTGGIHDVAPGIHGLSNHLLDTDWPKVHSGKERLQTILEEQSGTRLNGNQDLVTALFGLLTDQQPVMGAIPGDVEPGLTDDHLARHLFIRSPNYGTRCSTVVLFHSNGLTEFEERRFDPDGRESGRASFQFGIGP